MKTQFPKGVITAALTPMREDLSADLDKLVRHCQWLIDRGSNGLAILGTTGEAASFSLQEKIDLLQGIANSSLPLSSTMVGTGHSAFTDTIALTKEALSLGMRHVLLLPPFYYKQVDDKGLEKYFDVVLEKINDPDLRIYLYHIPQLTGISFSISLIEQLIKKYPEQIVGMKDSGGDFTHMQLICHEFPNFLLYAGTEKFLWPTLQAGGSGCISATANVTSAEAAAVFQSWLTSDQEGEKKQERLSQIRTAFEGQPFAAVLKQYLAMHQKDMNWLNIRPPNNWIPESSLLGVLTRLAELNFTI